MYKLVLLRHGESVWNKENRFTGWIDVGLSDKGVMEAKEAGRVLKEEGFLFDVAYTSVLKRAIKTLWLALEEMDLMWIPVHHNWRLNERHYGALQGLNKAETVEKHGMDQVKIWRRSYDVPPPALTPEDPYYPGHDRRYADVPKADLPLTECLKDVVARFFAVLARNPGPGGEIGPADNHRGPWQQPPGPGEIPGPHPRRGNRRPEHPHRHPPGIRTERRPHAHQALLPGGPGKNPGAIQSVADQLKKK